MKVGRWLADQLIHHAKRHPYYHLRHPGGEPYMDRYWLVKPRFWLPVAIRIHNIRSSDASKDMHDHPWSSVSVILRGGYWEMMPGGAKWRTAGDRVWRAATDRHRLLVPEATNCWSFFIMFGKQKEWGFHTAAGWVHHLDHLSGARPRPADAPIGITQNAHVPR